MFNFLDDNMVYLNSKYVFHIPLFKYSDGKLLPIEMDDLLDDLLSGFGEKGFENLYITNVTGYYKSRCFDELLITLFTPDDQSPEIIFKEWFKKNNNLLKQEEFAYEYNNTLIIEKLIQ